jgi:hypothetical protein
MTATNPPALATTWPAKMRKLLPHGDGGLSAGWFRVRTTAAAIRPRPRMKPIAPAM